MRGWRESGIKGRVGAGKRGLEVGCGSGAFSRALARAGYEMTGCDLSAPMLSEGMRLAREEGLRIAFVQAEAATLSLGQFDFLLSPNDCYNYLPPEKLPSAFRHAAASLKKGGIFWFDVSSERKLREKVADNVFADDRDEVTYLVFNHLRGDRVEMDVTLFVRRSDGAFDRYDERHTQYIHTTQALTQQLRAAGLEIVRVEGHLGEDAECSDRINLICRKP